MATVAYSMNSIKNMTFSKGLGVWLYKDMSVSEFIRMLILLFEVTYMDI